MIDAVKANALTLEKLEAMTCVCSVGLDMIAIPGDTPATTISGIIADEMAIGMVNQKTTAVRLIPVIGKGVGEMVEFGGLLGYAPIMPVNQYSCANFVNRQGRIPAPIHSFKKLIYGLLITCIQITIMYARKNKMDTYILTALPAVGIFVFSGKNIFTDVILKKNDCIYIVILIVVYLFGDCLMLLK